MPKITKQFRRLVHVTMLALAALTMTTAVTPATAPADPLNCPGGWWDPAANVCRGPVGIQAKFCDNGWWWNPVIDDCSPPILPG